MSETKSLTNGELKKILDQYPDDMPVLVQGYETGAADTAESMIQIRDMKMNHYDTWYQGPHEEDGFDFRLNPNKKPENPELTRCIVIYRANENRS